jgi:hypothetical protein
MPFNYPDCLESIESSVLTESGTYTEEMMFLKGAVNCLTCMGGPHYNPGTENILDAVFDQKGAKQAVEFLLLVNKASWVATNASISVNYVFFWNLFKSCNEQLDKFIQELKNYSKDLDYAQLPKDLIPESIKSMFN